MPNSTEYLRAALEAAGIGTWYFELRTGTGERSATAERLYGLEPGTMEASLDATIERVHPDDRAEFLRFLNETLAAGVDQRHEFRIVWPGGSVRRLGPPGRALPRPPGGAVARTRN